MQFSYVRITLSVIRFAGYFVLPRKKLTCHKGKSMTKTKKRGRERKCKTYHPPKFSWYEIDIFTKLLRTVREQLKIRTRSWALLSCYFGFYLFCCYYYLWFPNISRTWQVDTKANVIMIVIPLQRFIHLKQFLQKNVLSLVSFSKRHEQPLFSIILWTDNYTRWNLVSHVTCVVYSPVEQIYLNLVTQKKVGNKKEGKKERKWRKRNRTGEKEKSVNDAEEMVKIKQRDNWHEKLDRANSWKWF